MFYFLALYCLKCAKISHIGTQYARFMKKKKYLAFSCYPCTRIKYFKRMGLLIISFILFFLLNTHSRITGKVTEKARNFLTFSFFPVQDSCTRSGKSLSYIDCFIINLLHLVDCFYWVKILICYNCGNKQIFKFQIKFLIIQTSISS